ncbi:hypothetical protein MMPV_005899 [Pyropia vietnamensis]
MSPPDVSFPAQHPSVAAGLHRPPLIRVIVHGGAWAIPDAATAATLDGVRRAAATAHAILKTAAAAEVAAATTGAGHAADAPADAGAHVGSATCPGAGVARGVSRSGNDGGGDGGGGGDGDGGDSGAPLPSAATIAANAVEAAVRVLEADPVFDAGTGSVLNAAGAVECDALLMVSSPGAPLTAGAVAAVATVAHPVSLARAVAERTPHTLLVGAGADAYAAEQGMAMGVEEARRALVSPSAVAEWERYRRFPAVVDTLFNGRGVKAGGGGGGGDAEANGGGAREGFSPSPSPPPPTHPPTSGHDTVGAVVLYGDTLAAATSTGGITAKRVGRVGDSPLVGAGAYADAAVGGVSTTGHGESITLVTLARLALWRLEGDGGGDGGGGGGGGGGSGGGAGDGDGRAEAAAARGALATMASKTGGGCGGLVLIGRGGGMAAAFTTPRMAWAAVGGDGTLRSGIDEEL